MSDGGDTGGVSLETTPAESVAEVSLDSAHEIPQEPSMPGTDPKPPETPVITEPPVLEPQPIESPVIAPSPVENPEGAAEASPPPPPATETPPSSSPASNSSAPESVAPAPAASIRDRLKDAFAALRFRKERRLEKILTLARTKGKIKNDDVEKLLRVSDSTATRYLRQLVLEAKLFITKSGNDAWYEPVAGRRGSNGAV